MRRQIAGIAGTAAAAGLAARPIAGLLGGAAGRAVGNNNHHAHLTQQLLSTCSSSAATASANLVGVTAARAPLRWAAGASTALRGFHTRSHAAAAAGDSVNAPTPNSQMQDDFLSGTSAAYLESLEDKFREDPNSVPASWASFLRQMDAGVSGAELSEMYAAAKSGAAPVPMMGRER